MNFSDKDNLLLRQFNITHSIQIKLKKLKVPTARNALQRPFQAYGKVIFPCNECDFICFSNNNLNKHQKIHERTKPASKVCPFCKKAFKLSHDNYRHMKICQLNPKASDANWVAQQKRFKCQLCDYATIDNNYLKLHLRTHSDDRPFPCTLCQKAFTSRPALKQHQSRHSDKNIPCPLCPKLLCTKSEVTQHISIHTRERPFKCQFCEKRFKQSGALTGHVKVCRENPQQLDKDWVKLMKKFKCHLCNFSSVNKSALANHLRTHRGEKKFICRLCNWKCSTKFILNNHVRTHTGEKPFKCSNCTYRSARSCTLSSHFKRHHSTEPREKDAVCRLCYKRYYDRSSLWLHMKVRHGRKSRNSIEKVVVKKQ